MTGAPHVPVTTAAPLPAVLTPEELTGAIRDLATTVQGIRLYLAGPYRPPPAAPPTATNGPPLLPWQPLHQPASAALAEQLQPILQLSLPRATTSGPGPTSAPGVPLDQLRFPPSPSLLSAWVTGMQPVYTTASTLPYI
ncbi:hypothetical protein D1007_39660 [Hordeum vulgare]|nr:hypothetical protein D1007_39660 [Hordeum vulgare]